MEKQAVSPEELVRAGARAYYRLNRERIKENRRRFYQRHKERLQKEAREIQRNKKAAAAAETKQTGYRTGEGQAGAQ